jgi:hypothetical protein
MTTLVILFLIAGATGAMLWFGRIRDPKSGVFVLHLLIGFACVEGTAHLLRMSELAYVEKIRTSSNYALLLVAAIILSGLAVLGMHKNKNAARLAHAGAGLGALLMVISITRQLP